MDSQPAIESNKTPSLNILFDAAIKEMDAQKDQISRLDSKASFVLGSSSVLTAGLLTFLKTLLDTATQFTSKGLTGVTIDWWIKSGALFFVFLIMVCYFIIVLAAYLAYKPRKFRLITVVEARDKYLMNPPDDTKLALLDTYIDLIKQIGEGIKEKERWAQRAVRFFLLQTAFIAVLVLVQATLFIFALP